MLFYIVHLYSYIYAYILFFFAFSPNYSQS